MGRWLKTRRFYIYKNRIKDNLLPQPIREPSQFYCSKKSNKLTFKLLNSANKLPILILLKKPRR